MEDVAVGDKLQGLCNGKCQAGPTAFRCNCSEGLQSVSTSITPVWAIADAHSHRLSFNRRLWTLALRSSPGRPMSSAPWPTSGFGRGAEYVSSLVTSHPAQTPVPSLLQLLQFLFALPSEAL